SVPRALRKPATRVQPPGFPLGEAVVLTAGGDLLGRGDEGAIATGTVVVHQEDVPVTGRGVVRVTGVEFDDLRAFPGLPSARGGHVGVQELPGGVRIGVPVRG